MRTGRRLGIYSRFQRVCAYTNSAARENLVNLPRSARNGTMKVPFRGNSIPGTRIPGLISP